MKKIIFIFLSIFFIGCNTFSTKFVKSYGEKKVVAYYSATAAMLKKYNPRLEYITDLVLWFYNPDENYDFFAERSNDERVNRLIKLAKKNGVKVYLSIGGGAVSKKNSYGQRYVELLKPENYGLFSQKLLELAKKYGVAGVDLDLEGEMVLENYSDFIVLLSEKFRAENLLLTAAFNVYDGKKINDVAIKNFDYINLMAYNESGLFHKDLRDHSSIDLSKKHLEYWFNSRAVEAEKLILGVPFYGWQKIYDKENNLTDKGAITFSYIAKNFPTLAQEDNFIEIVTDKKRVVITYNSMDLIRKKCELSKNFGGIMIWHLNQDTGDGDLIRAIGETMGNLFSK